MEKILSGQSLVEATPAQPPRAERRHVPEIEITGGRGKLTLESLRELWVFREVLWAFALRSVKVTYKQAFFGVGWAVIRPVAAALIFTVFLGRVAKVGSEGLPYFIFALAGTSAWSYFSSASGAGMDALVTNAPILRKVYFPREVLPLAAVVSALVDLSVQIGILMVAAVLYGYDPTVTWIALPLPLVLLVLCAAALSISVAGPNVFYRDVRYALPFLLQLALFASPVVYSFSKIPEQWQTLYGILNPMAPVIDSIRRTLLHDQWPEWPLLAGALLWTLIMLTLGFALFKRLERGFADRV